MCEAVDTDKNSNKVPIKGACRYKKLLQDFPKNPRKINNPGPQMSCKQGYQSQSARYTCGLEGKYALQAGQVAITQCNAIACPALSGLPAGAVTDCAPDGMPVYAARPGYRNPMLASLITPFYYFGFTVLLLQ
jgi:hypothetical protein